MTAADQGTDPDLTDATQVETVGAAATSTVVESSDASSVFGESVMFTATVTQEAASTATPAGEVQFKVDGSDFGDPVALVAGQATSDAISSLSVGTHTVEAVFTDGAEFSTSTGSLAGDQVVGAAATSTVVESSDASSVFGESVMFTATVTQEAASTATPAGEVQFKVDGSDFGDPVALVAGQATSDAISSLSVGTHTVEAVFTDGAEFSTSTGSLAGDQVVGAAATSTVVESSDASSVFGESVMFTATVTQEAASTATPAGEVQFKVDGSDFGDPVALVAGQATSDAISSLSVGTHTVEAVFTDGAEFSTSTGSLAGDQVVGAAATSTVVESSLSPSVFGGPVTFTATVSADDQSTATPAGDVEFFDGLSSLGTATLVDGVGELSTSALSVGDHDVTAVFSDGAEFGGSTSVAIVQTVEQVGTSTVVESSLSPSVFGGPVTFTATVSADDQSTATPAGDGRVLRRGGELGFGGAGRRCRVELSTSRADVWVTTTITAVFSDGAEFGGSTSVAIVQTVEQVGTSTVVESSLSPSVFGRSGDVHGDGVGGCTVDGDAGRFDVEFFDGAASLGSVALVDGVGELVHECAECG